MRADVHQVIALAMHACAYLASEGENAPELLASNSNFTNLHELTFYRVVPGRKVPMIVAESVAPWFRRLTVEGVVACRVLVPEFPVTAKRGGEGWGVLTDGDNGLEVWTPHWDRRIAGFDDPRPYRVSYSTSRVNRWNLKPAPKYDVAQAALDEVREGILHPLTKLQPSLADAMRHILSLPLETSQMMPNAVPRRVRRLMEATLQCERLLNLPHARTGVKAVGMEVNLESAIAIAYEAVVNEFAESNRVTHPL